MEHSMGYGMFYFNKFMFVHDKWLCLYFYFFKSYGLVLNAKWYHNSHMNSEHNC